jgi:hypothetical protein
VDAEGCTCDCGFIFGDSEASVSEFQRVAKPGSLVNFGDTNLFFKEAKDSKFVFTEKPEKSAQTEDASEREREEEQDTHDHHDTASSASTASESQTPIEKSERDVKDAVLVPYCEALEHLATCQWSQSSSKEPLLIAPMSSNRLSLTSKHSIALGTNLLNM